MDQYIWFHAPRPRGTGKEEKEKKRKKEKGKRKKEKMTGLHSAKKNGTFVPICTPFWCCSPPPQLFKQKEKQNGPHPCRLPRTKGSPALGLIALETAVSWIPQ